MTDRVLIIDFGSQVTQLIARRVRESGVYSEVHPFNKVTAESLAAYAPKAVILSGGPASVTESHTPRAPEAVFALGVPVLSKAVTVNSAAPIWTSSRIAPCSMACGARAAANRCG